MIRPRRGLAALPAVVLLAASAGAQKSPPADGWSGPVPAPPDVACTIESPRVPLRRGAITLGKTPDAYPRPTIQCGTSVRVPLSSSTKLLEKQQQPETVLAWTPRITAVPRGGTAHWVDIDVLPYRPQPVALEPAFETLFTDEPLMRPFEPPRWRTDPSRLPGGPTSDDQPELPTVLPALVTTSVQVIEKDGRFLESGGKWVGVALSTRDIPANWFRLSQGEAFGAGGRLFVAPAPRHPRARLAIFEVDPATAAVTDLGDATPPGGSWRQEVSDMRERDGWIEALLIERDPSVKGDPKDKGAWAVLMRLGAEGWTRVDSYLLPRAAPSGSIRFDAANPKRVLLLSGGSTWERATP